MKPFDKIIILGHTGFMGGALVHYFEGKKTVPVLAHSSATIDLRHPESLKVLESAMSERTALIVASAITREKNDTFESFKANMEMTANVARFLESCPVGKCVYFSSISVYGDSKTDLALTEETGVDPDSFYALAKYAGEFILQEVSRRRGFPLLILRTAHVYGPGDTHATYGPMQFIRSLIEEKALYLFGGGEELRDHLFINDLVRLTDRLLCGNSSGIFNLATGQSHTFQAIVEIFKETVPYPFKVVQRNRKKLLIHQKFDIRKLREAAPDFNFIDLKQALKETFSDFYVLSNSDARTN